MVHKVEGHATIATFATKNDSLRNALFHLNIGAEGRVFLSPRDLINRHSVLRQGTHRYLPRSFKEANQP